MLAALNVTNPMPPPATVTHWPALDNVAGIRHGFIARVPDVDVDANRDVAMDRLAPHHRGIFLDQGLNPAGLATAEQVHGAAVSLATGPGCYSGVDALVTNQAGLLLGIYVADCAAVYFVDPVARAIGLAHSGRKGTEGQISRVTIAAMQENFGTNPGDLIAVISPCIRPPHYEVDFASEIRTQLAEGGVGKIVDSGICTGAGVSRFYSYRIENGRTGRMLAFLQLAE